MLSRPRYGWTEITIGDFKSSASYLTDVPNDLLDELIRSIENRCPACITFDAEGYDFTIVSDIFYTHVIKEKEDTEGFEYYTSPISKREFAKTVIEDIKSNLDAWADWECCENECIDAVKFVLSCKINNLKRIMEEVYGY